MFFSFYNNGCSGRGTNTSILLDDEIGGLDDSDVDNEEDSDHYSESEQLTEITINNRFSLSWGSTGKRKNDWDWTNGLLYR